MVVEGFEVDSPKTNGLIAKLKDLNVGRRPLIVTEDATEIVYLSARNLPYVQVRDVVPRPGRPGGRQHAPWSPPTRSRSRGVAGHERRQPL